MAQTPTPKDDARPTLVIVSAIVVLVAFAVLTIFMLSRASSDDETKWTRRVYIYGGVEAIVFAAAGALFGTTVQRSRVEKAEAREAEAQRTADANAAAATIARALEAELRAWRSGAAESDTGAAPSGLTEGIRSPVEGPAAERHAIAADDLAGHLLRVIDNLR